MLALGSMGMFRELFLADRPDMIRVGICIPLMLGPAVVLVWFRARTPESSEPGSSSPSPVSRSSSAP